MEPLSSTGKCIRPSYCSDCRMSGIPGQKGVQEAKSFSDGKMHTTHRPSMADMQSEALAQQCRYALGPGLIRESYCSSSPSTYLMRLGNRKAMHKYGKSYKFQTEKCFTDGSMCGKAGLRRLTRWSFRAFRNDEGVESRFGWQGLMCWTMTQKLSWP